MKGFIVDPVTRTLKEVELPATEKSRLKRIVEILGSDEYQITFIYPEEFRTCTGYLTVPERGAPFFNVKGFVDKVRFGRTVIIDKTATGVPESDGIALSELQPMVSFFP